MTSNKKLRASLSASLAGKKLVGFDTSASIQGEADASQTEAGAAVRVIQTKIGAKPGMKPREGNAKPGPAPISTVRAKIGNKVGFKPKGG